MANEANHNTLPWVQGNHLELALPMKIVYFTPNGKITQDYEPPTGSTICVEFQSNVNALCFTPTVEGNVLHVTDNGELPAGTYSVNIHVTEPNGDKRCSKLKNSIVVYDDNEETVDEFDDFPDWADGAIIDNEVFYFVGTKEKEYVTVDTFEQLPQEGVIGYIYRVANYDGTQVNPNAYAEYYWTGSQYKLLDIKNYGIDEKPENGSNNLVKSGGIKSALDEKANKNGYYETLGAGTATNLRAVDAHDDTFIYRKAGGSQEIANGTALLEGIKGNTLAWNQLVDTSTLSVSTTSTHKYYTNVSGVKSIVTGDGSGISVTGGTDMLLDLTLIYGAGNEPSTPEQFEADYQRWFGKPLTYEPYDAGSLRDVQLSGLKTVGFNLLNLERTEIVNKRSTPTTKKEFNNNQIWKRYAFNGYSGVSSREITITKNSVSSTVGDDSYGVGFPIKAFPNTKYYYKSTYGAVGFFDADGVYIGKFASPSGVFTTPENCEWIVVVLGRTTGEWKEENPIVNLSQSVVKDGTYEPYEEHEVSIPVTTLTGKLNGEGESVVIFPDGMKGVGNIKDEIYYVGGKTYAVKRIGRVDLGSLTWNGAPTIVENKKRFLGGAISNSKLEEYNLSNFLISKYSKIKSTYGANIDGIASGNNKFVVFIDAYSSYTNEQFQSAMGGVMADYELAEPLVYEVDDFNLPVNYEVNNWGTEEIINVENTKFVSPTLTLRYSIDAARTIENLPVGYQSQESMTNLLNALGAAMGGTWTTTFDTATNRYTYTFSRN